MRLFQRHDALLLTGLTVAIIVIFTPAITRLLDVAWEIERERGLALLPGLGVLVAVFVFHLLRRELERQAHAAATLAAQSAAEDRVQDLERLVVLGQALARAVDQDAIRIAVTEHLPRLAGTEHIWVMLRREGSWEALAGDTRGAEELVGREALADRLLEGRPLANDPSGGIAFPLVAGGTPIGVLGVTPASGALESTRYRAIEAAASMLAVSLKTAQLAREVRENRMRDPLTGCLLRAHAAEIVDGELRRARRSHLPVSLILFDLDHFKQINDRFGHLCGDAVLAAVGRCMREVLRGSDLKCRYGGEEFLVLLPETPMSGARRVAETLRREIADRPILWAGQTITFTASFGVTQALPGETGIQAMIARADAALYRAKEDGRNCVRIGAETLALISEQRKPSVAG